MKKILSLLLTCVMLFSFGGCGAEVSPEEMVSTYLDALKKCDMKALEEYGVSEKDFLSGIVNESDDISDKEKEQYDQLLKDLFSGITYEIKGSNISEDKKTATVDISITNADLSKAFENYFSKIFSLAFSGLSEKELEKKSVETLLKEINTAAKGDKVTNTAKVKLTKNEDDVWTIDEKGNDAFLNALSGGFFNAALDFAKGLK